MENLRNYRFLSTVIGPGEFLQFNKHPQPLQMQVMDRGTGRVAGEPMLEDERQWPGREARVVPGGPSGCGWGRQGKGENRCCLATCPQPDSARGCQVPYLSPGSGTLERQCRGTGTQRSRCPGSEQRPLLVRLSTLKWKFLE